MKHFEALIEPISSTTTKARIEKYIQFTKNFSELEIQDNKEKIFDEKIMKIIGRIGSESKYGEAYESRLVSGEVKFAIKLDPIPPREHVKMETTHSWKERNS